MKTVIWYGVAGGILTNRMQLFTNPPVEVDSLL